MINMTSIHKTYPLQLGEKKGYKALSDVSFHLKAGQTLGLIGANGAGKSSCIRMMMGFIKPDSGYVYILNQNPFDTTSKQQVGYLPEQPCFPKNLSCLEILHFCGKSSGMTKEKIVQSSEYWLKLVNLWDARHRLLRTYSKGMQQRASFAMALIHDPDLLILDEPMSGLDPIGRADIVKIIQQLQRQGKSILFCSHILDDVARIADQIVILHQGHVLFDGGREKLCATSESVETAFLRIVGAKI